MPRLAGIAPGWGIVAGGRRLASGEQLAAVPLGAADGSRAGSVTPGGRTAGYDEEAAGPDPAPVQPASKPANARAAAASTPRRPEAFIGTPQSVAVGPR